MKRFLFGNTDDRSKFIIVRYQFLCAFCPFSETEVSFHLHSQEHYQTFLKFLRSYFFWQYKAHKWQRCCQREQITHQKRCKRRETLGVQTAARSVWCKSCGCALLCKLCFREQRLYDLRPCGKFWYKRVERELMQGGAGITVCEHRNNNESRLSLDSKYWREHERKFNPSNALEHDLYGGRG